MIFGAQLLVVIHHFVVELLVLLLHLGQSIRQRLAVNHRPGARITLVDDNYVFHDCSMADMAVAADLRVVDDRPETDEGFFADFGRAVNDRPMSDGGVGADENGIFPARFVLHILLVQAVHDHSVLDVGALADLERGPLVGSQDYLRTDDDIILQNHLAGDAGRTAHVTLLGVVIRVAENVIGKKYCRLLSRSGHRAVPPLKFGFVKLYLALFMPILKN